MDRLGSCCVDEDASVKAPLHVILQFQTTLLTEKFCTHLKVRYFFKHPSLKFLNKQNYLILSLHLIYTYSGGTIFFESVS